MSFLTPLYLLGALAVAAPVVFHLIRRSPRGEVPFSSLMFLSPSPPRLTRRSRLDHVLLLLLRATALCLLAAAFARPFLRETARLDLGDVPQRRVVVLVDTSASLRRGDLWNRAKAATLDALSACRPTDQVAVLAFDATTRPVLGFAESRALEPSKRLAVARARLDAQGPSWGATNLGQALIDAVGAIEDVADANEKAGRMPRRVVLVSDLQQGARLDALGDFEWPSDVGLELRTVADDRPNAGLQWLADPAGGEAPGPAKGFRVRVSNDPGARQEGFTLAWVDAKGAATGSPVEAYVPPGESRVVRVPEPSGSPPPRALRLKGDAQEFDNTIFLAVEPREEATVLYVGPDAAEDPAGLLYYLDRVFPETARRGVRVVPGSPARPLELGAVRTMPLVVLAAETNAGNAGRLKRYVEGGGTVLAVLTAPGRLETLATIAGVPAPEVADAPEGRDVLLGEIAFDHPLFAAFAGAQFNDFTKIHFWKHRRLPADALEGARVVARFEDGDPAVLEKAVGKGRLVVLASGWAPADSQLARSSKFVPLMSALLEGRGPGPLDGGSYLVHDRVPLPPAPDPARGLVVHKPDGSAVTAEAGASAFTGTDQPGVYTVDTADGPRPFAVNLDPAEGRTARLDVETLEQYGCRLADPSREAADREHLRQLHNAELENRQKLWRWLVVATVGVLILETWLAGRLARPRAAPAEATAP